MSSTRARWLQHGTLHVRTEWPVAGVLVFRTRRMCGRSLARWATSWPPGLRRAVPDITMLGRVGPCSTRRTLFTDTRDGPGCSAGQAPPPTTRSSDAGAYADSCWAAGGERSAIGTTGTAWRADVADAAGGLGRTIATAASVHGGRVAVAEDPVEPAPGRGRITATVYRGRRHRGRSFTRAGGLLTARSRAPVEAHVGVLPAHHASRCPTTRRPTTPRRPPRHWEHSGGCIATTGGLKAQLRIHVGSLVLVLTARYRCEVRTEADLPPVRLERAFARSNRHNVTAPLVATLSARSLKAGRDRIVVTETRGFRG